MEHQSTPSSSFASTLFLQRSSAETTGIGYNPLMPISNNAMVTLQYSFRDKEGFIKDFTPPGSITFVQGRGHMLPGIEHALMGKNVGDRFQITLPPAEAFGEFNQNLFTRIPKDQFVWVRELKPGMQVDMLEPDGSVKPWTLVGFEGDLAVLDGNHPMAGLNVIFDLTVQYIHEMRA